MPNGPLAVALASISVVLFTTPAKTELRCADPIPATLIDRIDSATAYPGERFRFKTTADAVHGQYAIPKDTQGYGYVRYVRAAASHNRGGVIVLEPRILVIGEMQLPVMWDPMETAQYASSATLSDQAIGYVPIPFVSTAVNYARTGRNIVIGPGFQFHVVVLDESTTSEPCARVPVATPAPPSPRPS